MTTNDVEREIAQLARQARELATRVPFHERANILRAVTYQVREGVKHDPTMGGAPLGRDWELDGLGQVGDAAEAYYFKALMEHRRRAEGR